MENQDKLYEQFQQASQKAESKNFPAMDKVWARVEDKLDKKEDKKVIALWKKIAVAASLLLCFSLGYQLFTIDEQISAPGNPIVIEQNNTSTKTSEKTLKSNEIVVEKTTTKSSFDKKEVEKALKSKTIKSDNSVVATTEKETEQVRADYRNVASSDAYFTSTKKEGTVADSSLIQKKKTEIVVAEQESEMVSKTLLEDAVVETKVTTDALTGEKTITGVVTEQGLPLPGVSVVVRGTTKGTQTDYDGKFSIKASKGETLKFSYIGFSEQLVTVGRSNKIIVALEADQMALEGVVVSGYRVKKAQERAAKSSIASNIKENESNDFNYYRGNIYYKNKENATETNKGYVENDNPSVIQSLQGAVAGLNITHGSGQPGSDTTIVLRGVGVLNGNLEPLIIVDGMPVDEEGFRTVKQGDIVATSILKDKAATSIYGSRGSNGVILITTKNGKYKNLSKKELRKKLRELKKGNKQTLLPKEIPVSEEYESFIENPFENPINKPLSTFSIDVDNASYTNVRRFINNGQTVPKDAVRVEEMVNFFKYDYPLPKSQDPFSINTEYSVAPWNPEHKILRIGLQGKSFPIEDLPASNLVFLIDVSGSMNDQNKLPLLKESMKILVNELRKKDKVSIVVYAGAAGIVLPPTAGSDKKTIINALEKLNAGGSTAGGQGIELAYKIAQENFIKNGNNRVVLATDGDFNVGNSSDTDMQTLIEEKRKSGVFLTCLGYGMGNYKDKKMEILSDKGNGNYAYIDNIQEANRFLGKEFKGSMFAIAKDVKIQIEFNPQYVQSYRLIGYENRKLRDEDFKNDAIDAGELGSGHTVTALYEIIPVGIKSNYSPDIDNLKFTKSESTSANFNNQLAFIRFRYKKPDGATSIEMEKFVKNEAVALENASGDFKFCTAVAWFGLKLRASKLIPNKSSDEIKKLAKQGLQNDPDGYKAEFIRLVKTAK